MSKHLIRSLKNITNGYSGTEIKVRNATSNDPWGPSTAQMHEIALLTFKKKQMKFIINILYHRLTDKGRNWRHIVKALSIMHYCLFAASGDFLEWITVDDYLVTPLQKFVYIDKNGIDQGSQIRDRAKKITKLVQDKSTLDKERERFHSLRNQLSKPGLIDDKSNHIRRSYYDPNDDGFNSSNINDVSNIIEDKESLGSSKQDFFDRRARSFESPRPNLGVGPNLESVIEEEPEAIVDFDNFVDDIGDYRGMIGKTFNTRANSVPSSPNTEPQSGTTDTKFKSTFSLAQPSYQKQSSTLQRNKSPRRSASVNVSYARSHSPHKILTLHTTTSNPDLLKDAEGQSPNVLNINSNVTRHDTVIGSNNPFRSIESSSLSITNNNI